MNKFTEESEAMREVRRWKKECASDVAGLDVRAAVRKRLEDSRATASRLGFTVPHRDEIQRQLVAESKVPYGKQ